MKHVVQAYTLPAFLACYEQLVKRLEETGEKVCRARFVFDGLSGGVHKAVLWTKQEARVAAECPHWAECYKGTLRFLEEKEGGE